MQNFEEKSVSKREKHKREKVGWKIREGRTSTWREWDEKVESDGRGRKLRGKCIEEEEKERGKESEKGKEKVEKKKKREQVEKKL